MDDVDGRLIGDVDAGRLVAELVAALGRFGGATTRTWRFGIQRRHTFVYPPHSPEGHQLLAVIQRNAAA